jgi:hypothetical protein
MKISKLKMLKIEETLKDFKCLVPRFNEVKEDKVLLKEFCMRNRNPIWDLTTYTKNTDIMNYVAYDKVGIKVDGLMDIINSSPAFVKVGGFLLMSHINRTPSGRIQIPPPPFFWNEIYLYIK